MTTQIALKNLIQTFMSLSKVSKICLFISIITMIATIGCLIYGAYNKYFVSGVNLLFWVTLALFFLSVITLIIGCYHLQLNTLVFLLMVYIFALFTTIIGFS